MTNTKMTYRLKKPCAKCPFRTDIEPYLRPDRAAEIASALRGGSIFSCHETTVPSEAEDGAMVPGPGDRFCAGAMATMEREGFANQTMRIAERLGFYDAAALKANEQPVHPSLTAWVQSHYEVDTVVDPLTGELLEYEHCGVVGESCEDPAGYGGFGGAHANADPPSCNPLRDNCMSCGDLACGECRSEEWDDRVRLCRNCAEEEEL
jgi:hypothetical protein